MRRSPFAFAPSASCRSRAASVGDYPPTASSSSVAPLCGIAALIVVAAAGAAVAVIFAISAGGSTSPLGPGLRRATITVTTHAQ
jgi:hypothetical protein